MDVIGAEAVVEVITVVCVVGAVGIYAVVDTVGGPD